MKPSFASLCLLLIAPAVIIATTGLGVHNGNETAQFKNSVDPGVVFPGDLEGQEKNHFQNYRGKPWNNTPQSIPGKVQCEWYDVGGEEIAYHDVDSINNGSGKLNPKDGSFLNEFRMKEGVDISYTKAGDIDNNPFNVVAPQMEQLYTGWTEPGEWINYTVDVKKTGDYSLALMYTANGDGGISLLIDGQKLTGDLLIVSTHNDADTIAWRQWHHWNKARDIAQVNLQKGRHVLTLQTTTHGNMNYDYLEFTLLKK